jgi:FkbM family methyltransferase
MGVRGFKSMLGIKDNFSLQPLKCYAFCLLPLLSRELLMLKEYIQKTARNLGVEIRGFNITVSDYARLRHFLNYYNIDLVLDVGANVGQYSSFLRELGYSKKIISFEPLSAAHAQLTKVSAADPLWQIAERMAIGNVDDEITINIASNSVSSSILPMVDSLVDANPSSAYVSQEQVRVSKIDTISKDYLAGYQNIFLKVDVQGFEKFVIEGAAATLPYIKGIQLEMSLVPLYEGELVVEDMLAFMGSMNYSLYNVMPGFADPKTGRLLQMDGLFFREDHDRN